MVFFVVCLLALGFSFFFGLMTGLSGRPTVAGVAASTSPTAVAAGPSEAEVAPGAETSPETRTEPEVGGESAGPGEPTPPAVLQAFEDRASEPTPTATAARRPVAASSAPPAAPGVWIQVASLVSRPEADALAARLSRHGYRSQIAAAQSPKGKVFRVRVGPYRSEEDATRAAERLRKQEKIRQTWVVREGR